MTSRPIRGDGRHAGDEVHPASSRSSARSPRSPPTPDRSGGASRAGRGLDRHQQPGVAPADIGEVREDASRSHSTSTIEPSRPMTCSDTSALAVPAAGYGSSSVARGIGGITEGASAAPAPCRRGDGEGRAVGAPPVAAVAVHLLGGDEVRRAPRHRLRLVRLAAGQQAPATVELADAQQAPADVRHPLRQRIRPGSNTGPATGSSRAVPLSRPPTNSRPPTANDADGDGGIGGEGGIPPADSRTRSRRARSSGGGPRRHARGPRVGDEALLTRRRRRPEAVDRVGHRRGCAGTRCAGRPATRPRREARRA